MTETTEHRATGPEQRYAVLMDIGRTLAGTLRPEELYPSIYEQTSRVLETTGFYISLYDAARDEAAVVFYADRGKVERVRVCYRGSASAAIREARPVLQRLDHTEHAALLHGHGASEITRASISAPMLREGRVLGVISAQSYRVDAYDARDLELLAAVADLAAVALDNARHVEEIDRRRREAERLEEIGRALAGSLELSRLLERIANAALDLADADAASVWLLRDDGRAEVAFAAGRLPLAPGTVVPVPPRLRERVADRRESLVLERLSAEPLLPPRLAEVSGLESGIAVPLVAEDRVIGVLAVAHCEPRRYKKEDVRLLERLGYQAAVAMENAQLHEQIRALSLTDPLTELPNRRHLEIVLEKEFAAARRGRPLAVVLFDLNNFKAYNDTYGHQAGDAVLRAFGRILSAEIRAMNLTARYGGDEFIAVLSDSTHLGALSLVRRIDGLVRQDPVLERAGITASAGIATYAPGMASPDELIQAADQDLYRRKKERKKAGVPVG